MIQRIQNVHIFVLTIVILYAIGIQTLLAASNLNPVLGSILVLLTSVGFYRLIIVTILYLINRNDRFLMYYWNQYYLKGFWSYSYSFDGVIYRGIWRVDQDIYHTKVFGTGINDHESIRSIYWSVTDLIDNSGAFDIVMKRTDINTGTQHYTLTTVVPQFYQYRWYKPLIPFKLRAVTYNYGGGLSNKVHSNVLFVKHIDAKTEDDVIKALESEKLLNSP